MESENLRRRLQKELALFNNELSNYFLNGNLTENDKHTVAQRIIEHLQKNSAFSAFKIWIIRSKERYMADFGQHIPV
jgi:DTW domain-containing protein YfiP